MLAEHSFSGDTICAIATGSGTSAQGVVKVSGTKAIDVVATIFSRPEKLRSTKGYQSYYGWVLDPSTGEQIDDVLALVMLAPHSYTGENQVELSCHGSPFILSLVLKLLIGAGARLAEPGEFTRRAFANGKMDLSQAEAVADVIASTNRATLRISLTQMRGGFSKKIEALRTELVHFASLLELELDFSEEDVEFVSRAELASLCKGIQAHITALHQSYENGQVIKNGIPIAIIGQTNAGKSTLLNTLLQEERAIVSDIHGTTRDTIEERILIKGQEFRLIDTAGIRHTSDEIERIGIERSYQNIAKAALTLWIIDATTEGNLNTMCQELTQHTPREQITPLVNKADLATPTQVQSTVHSLRELGFAHIITLSAKKEEEVEQVKEHLSQHFAYLNVHEGEVLVSNLRQANALQTASHYLKRTLEALNTHLTSDLVAQELRSAIRALSEVTGDITSDTILHSVFRNFCIGK